MNTLKKITLRIIGGCFFATLACALITAAAWVGIGLDTLETLTPTSAHQLVAITTALLIGALLFMALFGAAITSGLDIICFACEQESILWYVCKHGKFPELDF